MNDLYRINDDRPSDSFKKKTFSGFKKNEIINAVLKSIETKKVENACFWTTECILSGYSLILWEKLLNFSGKIIHINNPKLPYYLLRKNTVFMNQINRLSDATGAQNPADYQEDAFVHQLDRDGSTLRTYKFFDVFPTNISQVDLSYETIDTLEEFQVELQVLYWESIKGVGANAGGESIS